jgi:hypothetical protein
VLLERVVMAFSRESGREARGKETAGEVGEEASTGLNAQSRRYLRRAGQSSATPLNTRLTLLQFFPDSLGRRAVQRTDGARPTEFSALISTCPTNENRLAKANVGSASKKE